jgi:hypothetical protein
LCIIFNKDSTNKVNDFLDNNNFHKLPKDPTDKYQKKHHPHPETLQFDYTHKTTETPHPKKPLPPSLKALIKIHKPDNLIRPIVNNTNAPTYKIAKFLVKKLHEHLHLKYHYNVKDPISLANDLTKLKINEHHRLITVDIKKLYVRIPITETLALTKQLLSEHNEEQITTHILMLLESVLQQNYFSFQNNTYQPEKEVSMGSPISNTVAEIFLQYLENTHVKHILESKQIVFYTRYVDDILMIYNTKYTTPRNNPPAHQQDTPHLQFTPSHENNSLCILDLLLIRQPDKIEIDIYRKPTTTDTTINYTSSHPNEHKKAAYRYLTNRMTSLPLTTDREETEWQKIFAIAKNNNFPVHLITRLKRHTQQKTHTDNTDNKTKKWTTFTYHSHKVRKITNLFRQTDIKIAFRSTNTIQQQTRTLYRETTTDHNKSGICKLQYKTCNKAYIGQTKRITSIRYSEHIRYTQKKMIPNQHTPNTSYETSTNTTPLPILCHS